MAKNRKDGVPFCGVDPQKAEDMQRLAEALRELSPQELAYISGAVQMARLMAGIREEVSKQPPDPQTERPIA